MSNKAIILNFKDAKIWEYGETFFHGKNAYYKQQNMKVPLGTLYYKHIANMLHVLMGERPVSTFWSYSVDKLNDQITDAAKNAVVRIDTPVVNDRYPKELVATNKPSASSWMKSTYLMQVGSKTVPVCGSYPTWDTIVGYFGAEHFSVFKTVCDTLCGADCLSTTFSSFIKEYGEHKSIIEFAENYASENKLGQFLNFIRGWAFNKKAGKKLSLLESNYAVKFTTSDGVGKYMPHVHYRLNPKGIENAYIISGSIVVPVDDTMLDKIAKGPGCATILEGGVVSIADIRKMSDNMVSDYTKVWMGE